MADPYARRRNELKAEVLARVAAGTPIRSLCADPGMPCDTTLRNWRRTDESFRVLLAEALRKGRWRRKWMYDEARAGAFLTRYRAGEPIHRILADPAMPSRRVYNFWIGTHQPFAEEVHRLKGEREPHRLRGLRRAKTPTPWDPKAADRVLVRLVRGERLKSWRRDDPTAPGPATPGRPTPGRGVIARWRREQPQFDAEVRAALKIGQRRDGTAARRCAELQHIIVGRILEGASLHSLGRAPDMPCPETLYRWVREQPGFAEAVARACEDREDWYLDGMQEIVQASPFMTQRQMRARLAPLSRQLARLRHRPGKRRPG